ncbi:expressed unknown protein [Seminavis robusta]|uniref:Uncharacterized protein n=1 Tax=Seminavis robusta TaxID=568900 RepID=A0A9N8E1F7_9STRA|nr:expressed unknown protein [Seminavis robusta]|eukprot:Sro551_g164980.1 n/a (299) ;mRNA; f:58297-59193
MSPPAPVLALSKRRPVLAQQPSVLQAPQIDVLRPQGQENAFASNLKVDPQTLVPGSGQALQDSYPQTDVPKIDVKFYLHNACRTFTTEKDVVEIALSMDPQAICRQEDHNGAPSKAKKGRETITFLPWKTFTPRAERYSYPVNVALQNKASMDVMSVLVYSGPDVLLQQDGYDQRCSLSIALSHNPKDLDLIDLVLFANMKAINLQDPKLNYPLHVAASKGASVDVLKRLYTYFPAALLKPNLNGETPYDIARRSMLVDERALKFLQKKHFEGCLQRARRNFGQVPKKSVNTPLPRPA